MVDQSLLLSGVISQDPVYTYPSPKRREEWFLFLLLLIVLIWIYNAQAFAGTRIPGTDASDKLEAAGTLLHIVDSVLFSWGARIFAGLCVMSAGWNLKEQRFGIAVLCVIAAIVLGTAPTWVKNIFDIGGGGGIFTECVIKNSEVLSA